MRKSVIALQLELAKNCLHNGMKRAEILAKFATEYPTVAERTIDRRIRQAETALSETVAKITGAEQQAIDNITNNAAFRVLSIAERLDILSKIALGELKIKQHIFAGAEVGNIEVDVEPNYQDRRAAIAEINKMFGHYAPEKKDVTFGEKKEEAPAGVIVLSNGTQIPFG